METVADSVATRAQPAAIELPSAILGAQFSPESHANPARNAGKLRARVLRQRPCLTIKIGRAVLTGWWRRPRRLARPSRRIRYIELPTNRMQWTGASMGGDEHLVHPNRQVVGSEPQALVQWKRGVEGVEASSSGQVVCFDSNMPRDVSHSLMHLPARSLACAGR